MQSKQDREAAEDDVFSVKEKSSSYRATYELCALLLATHRVVRGLGLHSYHLTAGPKKTNTPSWVRRYLGCTPNHIDIQIISMSTTDTAGLWVLMVWLDHKAHILLRQGSILRFSRYGNVFDLTPRAEPAWWDISAVSLVYL